MTVPARWLSGGLRRCEVLGLRLEDLHAAERRVFIAEGKGGRQRLIPVSGRFFAAVAAYLDAERPPGTGTDRVFVVLKGPRRGLPLSAKGTDEVLAAARRRAGLEHATCHQLRHTCLPGCGRPGWRWRRCRPRPGMPRSSPPGYLTQIGCVLRPGSVGGADLALRSFAAFLAQTAPGVTSTAQVTRRHIEDYKPWLALRPGQNKTAGDHRDHRPPAGHAADVLRPHR